MKRVLVVFVLVVALAVFASTVWFLWKKSQAPPVVFEIGTPVVTDIVRKAVATGSVVPRREVTLKPQVSGIVSALHVQAGDVVDAGDLVATIRIIPDSVALANSESRLNRAQIVADDSVRELERQRKLRLEGTVAETALQRAEVAAAQAREELSAARDNLQIVRQGATRRSSATSNTIVTSTVAGMVLEVPVEVGGSVIEANTFNEGTTIATVADMGELVFEGKVDESEVGKLVPGMKLLLTVGALEDRKLEATLEHVAPKGVPDGGAIKFEIRAALARQGDVFVRANYSANADIVLEERKQVLALDEALLQFDEGKPYVEVEVAPQTYERRDVQVGLSDGLHAEIVSGVAAQDRIKKPRPLAGT